MVTNEIHALTSKKLLIHFRRQNNFVCREKERKIEMREFHHSVSTHLSETLIVSLKTLDDFYLIQSPDPSTLNFIIQLKTEIRVS